MVKRYFKLLILILLGSLCLGSAFAFNQLYYNSSNVLNNGQDRVYGIHNDGTNIWVYDFGPDKVFKYDTSLNYLGVTSKLTNSLEYGRDVFQKNGYLYVADYSNSQIDKYTTTGSYITSYSIGFSPEGLYYNTNDGYWYITSSDEKVRKYNTGFNLIATFDLSADFNGISSLTFVTKENQWYITNTANKRLMIYDTLFNLQGYLNLNTTINPQPRDADYYNGKFYVTDDTNNNIVIYNTIKIIAPIINSNMISYYNTNNIDIHLNTTTNTNMSYFLDNNSITNICNNCNSTTLNLNSLIEGAHSIIFESTDSKGQVNSTYNFTIDTIKPNITLIPEMTYNKFNLSDYCSDLNLDYCNIIINGTIYNSSQLINISQFGNNTYIINAKDKANNINILNSSFIYNPYVNVTIFDDKRLIYLDNYYLNNIYYTNESKLKYFDISNSLDFRKTLYSPITFNISNQDIQDLNLQLNVTPAHINLLVYDYSTKNLLTNWSLEIKKNLITWVSASNLSEYTAYYSNDINGNINILINKPGYYTSQLSPYLNINSTITQKIYLVPSTSPKLFPLQIMDRSGKTYLSDVSVSVYTLDNLVDEYFYTELKTDASGKVYLTLDPNSNYKIVLTKDNYVKTTEYITPTDYTYTFYMTTTITNYQFDYDGFTYYMSFTPLFDNNISQFNCYYVDSKFLINSVTCNLYRSFDTLFNLNSVSTNSLSDNLEFNVPMTDYFREYTMVMRVVRDGKIYNFTKKFQVDGKNDTMSKPEYKLSEILKQDSYLQPFILMFVLIISLILGGILLGVTGSLLGLILGLFILTQLSLISYIFFIIFTLIALILIGYRSIFGGGQ